MSSSTLMFQVHKLAPDSPPALLLSLAPCSEQLLKPVCHHQACVTTSSSGTMTMLRRLKPTRCPMSIGQRQRWQWLWLCTSSSEHHS